MLLFLKLIQTCNRYSILLSLGPYTCSVTLVLVGFAHVYNLRRSSKNRAGILNERGKGEEVVKDLKLWNECKKNKYRHLYTN